jgi:DNA-binding beta-propeller fold protein YncE
VDEEGYLYVVDYGNRRISKFDPTGAFILSFGTRSLGFPGFISPTGIASSGGIIYVADNLLRQIFMFDTNGSYLGVFVQDGLLAPESLRFLSDGNLLVVDSNRILLINPDTAIIRELGVLRNPASVRITGAEMDSNGNLLAADFRTGEVAVMTRIDDMASGLFVDVRRVVSDAFPQVILEVEVTDRLRRPVMGLDDRNFVITEGGLSVREQAFRSAAHHSENTDVSILIERSSRSLALQDDIAVAVRDINEAVGNVVSIVSAGEQPMRENVDMAQGTTPAARLASAASGSPDSYSEFWRFDQGLRLAATDLLPGEKKRAVIFVGTGAPLGLSFGLGDFAFEQYSLGELASYLRNNNIAFYAVIVGNGPPGGDILYLAEETGGSVLSLHRDEGIIPELARLRERPVGNYFLSFRSSLPTDFGRAFLPVEVEVYLMERSGRDSVGYFPPLE